VPVLADLLGSPALRTLVAPAEAEAVAEADGP